MTDPGPLRLAYLADPIETHTHRWLRWFAARGHRVDLVVPYDAKDDGSLPEGINLIRLPEFGGRSIRPLGYLDARAALRKVFAELDPDVVHAHYLTGYGWLAWVSGFRPYAITVWGSDVFRTIPASRKARWFGRLSLRGAALVTADSKDLAEASIRAGARRERTDIIQFGVETTRFAPAPPNAELRRRLGIPDGRLVFSPRILMSWNRHDLVVRALRELPADVRLLFSARHADPAVRASLVALAEELGLGGRIHFVEDIPHDEMADHLRLADVIVSIPETDGTPVTILESLACGVPVVASDVPSVVEWLSVVTPELLVPIGDGAATTRTIRAALELDPARRAEMAAAGRRLVVEQGDHDTNMRAVEDHYRRLAGSRSRARSGRPARVAD
ncbi:MAG TPA: glycosyltransferase [Candidatus Limnocylindrales bacterium]